MKRALATIATLLTLAGCSNNHFVDGRVIGEEVITPWIVSKGSPSPSRERWYWIEGDSGDLYMAMAIPGKDPLNTGDDGSFLFGKRLFNGTVKLYSDEPSESQRKLVAYELEGFIPR